MAKSKIEWTQEVWNPIAGCNDVSPGCTNCYARGMAGRLEAMGSAKYAGLTILQGSHRVWTGKIAFDEKALMAPLKRKKPTTYFVNSMSDLFHPNVTAEQRDQIFAVMALCPQHTFQVLTKRPERMSAYLGDQSTWLRILRETVPLATGDLRWSNPAGTDGWYPLPNVRLGATVENQKAAGDRIDYICDLASQGWNTMVSFEPLLGAVAPGEWWLSLGKKTWAIVGGESGHGARPMHPDWARSLRDQCKSAGVPFFFKQWGKLCPGAQGGSYGHTKMSIRIDQDGRDVTDLPGLWSANDGLFYPVGKKAAGHLLDGIKCQQIPESK